MRTAKRSFVSIQNAWEQELLKSPAVDQMQWTDEAPVILKDEGLTFMFKELVAQSPAFEVTEEGKTIRASLETTGYAVARQAGDGRWIPTPIYFPDKESAEDALAEMQKIRDQGRQ